MKNKLLTVLSFLLISSCVFSQRGYWGVGTINNPWPEESQHGFIYRTDILGDSLFIVHEFTQTDGKYPFELLLASNGNLYGATLIGGDNNAGVIFEYDLVHDEFRVVHHFLPGSPATPYPLPSTAGGLAEVLPGIIYGQVTTTTSVPAPRGHVFSYNINTETVSSVVAIPSFNGGPWNDAQNNYLRGKFFKASNGFVYAAGARNSTCPTGQPDRGSIFRINTNNNTISTVYLNQCSGIDGFQYNSSYIERDGKLYGTAGGGDGIVWPGNINGYGLIYEFNTQNNTYSKIYEFPGITGGEDPHPELFEADNGKWYGTTQRGGTDDKGTLYSYDPETNEADVKHSFVQTNQSSQLGPYGRLLLLSSNGKLYGTNSFGLFSYDPVADTLKKVFRKPKFNSNTLIEVCQKPSFKPFATYEYTLCEGTLFAHDFQSPNWETMTWTQNGEVVPSQTTANLEFSAISSADAGIWQLTLTNECGVSTPPAITISVLPSTSQTVTSDISPAGALSFCPGDTIVLNGNQGGVWNTGETSPSIQVTQPGIFQITNSNACGATYSNVVYVDTLHMPQPEITVVYKQYCPGDSMVVFSNVEGLWNNGIYGNEITVPANPLQTYFQINEWTCSTDTSNYFNLPPTLLTHDEPWPEITYEGDLILCDGSDLVLYSNNPQIVNSVYYWYWKKLNANGTFGYVSGEINYTVTQPGTYVLEQRTPCNVYRYSDTLTITMESGPPQVPSITSSAASFHICPGDSIVFFTDAVSPLWSTGDTTSQIVVYNSGSISVSDINACGTTTSSVVEVQVSTSAILTNVSWNQEIPNLCLISEDIIELSGASPLGGIFSGPGISDAIFSPSEAGVGSHLLYYTFTNNQGCIGTDSIQVFVQDSLLTQIPEYIFLIDGQSSLVDSIIDICQNQDLAIIAFPTMPGEWYAYDTLPVIFPEESGIFKYRYKNACGVSPWGAEFEVSFYETYSVEQEVSICPNESFSIGGNVYFQSGIYTDTLASVNGCDSIIVTTLLPLELPDLNNSVEQIDNSLAAVESNAFYQWVDCESNFEEIAGATSQTFYPELEGSYAVKLTSTLCDSVTVFSECIPFSILNSRNSNLLGSMRIYPNPAQTHLQIDSRENIQKIEISDAGGRVVADFVTNDFLTRIDIRALSTGFYFLHIHLDDEVRVEKFVKQK